MNWKKFVLENKQVVPLAMHAAIRAGDVAAVRTLMPLLPRWRRTDLLRVAFEWGSLGVASWMLRQKRFKPPIYAKLMGILSSMKEEENLAAHEYARLLMWMLKNTPMKDPWMRRLVLDGLTVRSRWHPVGARIDFALYRKDAFTAQEKNDLAEMLDADTHGKLKAGGFFDWTKKGSGAPSLRSVPPP